MKIRYGFVTNSSSSSFILSFRSKNNILEELAKERLSDKELSLLASSVSGGTIMSREQLWTYVKQEVSEELRYRRWAENRDNRFALDWDTPLKGKWKQERDRKVKELMALVPLNTHIVQINAGINSLSGNILAEEILPGLSVTKLFFCHH